MLVPLIVALPLWLMISSAFPVPLFTAPGSPRFRLFATTSVPPVWVPVTAPISAAPVQPAASETRFRSPFRLVAMLREYAPGVVTENAMLWTAVPLSVRLPLDSSSLRFQVNLVASTVPVLVVIAATDFRKKVAPDSSALLPVVVAEAPEIDCARARPAVQSAMAAAAARVASRREPPNVLRIAMSS